MKNLASLGVIFIMHDVNKIVNDNKLEDVIASYVKLKIDGSEYVGLCPFHNEKTPSFRVIPRKGFYHCHGCNASGDVIDFVKNYHGVGFKEACAILGGQPTNTRTIKIDTPFKDPYMGFTPVGGAINIKVGQAINIFNIKQSKWKQYHPVAVHTYYDKELNIVGYVFRIVINGHKITPTVQLVRDKHGNTIPALMPFTKPRPIYGLETLKKDGNIFIVEGEKTVDALRQVLPSAQVISWSMGSNNVDKSDWGVLPRERKYIMIPDADYKNQAGSQHTVKPFEDQIGYKAMATVEQLLPQPKKTFIVNTHRMGKIKDGWDIADANFTRETFKEWLLESWTI